MRVGAVRERTAGEARVALTPDCAKQLAKLGHECSIEAGAGVASGLTNDLYRAAGVAVVEDVAQLYSDVDVVVKVRPPEPS